jgi:hypothetical protein
MKIIEELDPIGITWHDCQDRSCITAIPDDNERNKIIKYGQPERIY